MLRLALLLLLCLAVPAAAGNTITIPEKKVVCEKDEILRPALKEGGYTWMLGGRISDDPPILMELWADLEGGAKNGLVLVYPPRSDSSCALYGVKNMGVDIDALADFFERNGQAGFKPAP